MSTRHLVSAGAVRLRGRMLRFVPLALVLGVTPIAQAEEVVGACCFGNGACRNLPRPRCEVRGGAFQGEGTRCERTDCPRDDSGACCFPDGSCTDGLTEEECGGQDGAYQGANTRCNQSQCPIAIEGACCREDGSCAVVPLLVCADLGGDFQGEGVSCEDACEMPCAADLDGDGETDFSDVLILLASWGPCPPPCQPDIVESGLVDFNDLLALLNTWGSCP